MGAHVPAHDPRRADPQRGARAASGRAHRALDPRALGRPGLPRRAARRRDPAGSAGRRGVRRLRRHDHRPRVQHRGGPRRRLPGVARRGRQPVRSAGRRRLHRGDFRARCQRAGPRRRRGSGAGSRRSRAHAARIGQARGMPPISRGFRRAPPRRRPRSPPARPVPRRRLPGPLGRADAPHAARRVEPDHPRRGRRGGLMDVGGAARAADRDLHRRHPLRDEVVQARHDWTGVSVDTLLEDVETEAEYVTAWCDGDYTTNLPLEDLTRRQGVGRARRSAASRWTPSTAARRGCSCRTCTSGRARSGCAA